MKRLSLLFALSFVLLSFGLTNAIDFDVVVDPSYMWNDGGDMKIIANQEFVVELQMGNTIGTVLGFGLNQVVYGTGVITSVTYTQDFGIADFDDATPIPGLESLWGTQWEAGNFFYNDGWDGNLPDTMAHSALSFAGWTQGALTTKYKFYMSVAMADGDVGDICLDKVVGHPNGDHDWLFAEAANYDGPFCFPVAFLPNQPPVVDCPDVQQSTPHHIAFDMMIPVSDPEGDPITGVTASLGNATLEGSNIHWVYDPPCSDVGQSLSVTFTASDAFGTGNCTTPIAVTNSAPVIAGDCDELKIIGTNSSIGFSFTATDANTGDSKTFTVSAVTTISGDAFDGTIDISGGNITVNSAAGTGEYSAVVTVEDCAGATDECTFFFNIVGELPFIIKIEKDEGPDGIGAYLGQHTQVDIIKTQGTEEIHGFDFLIAYDNSAMAFTGAFAGAIFDIPGTHEFEYFTYRFGATGNCGGGCPSGLLRVVGIADQNDGPHNPVTNMVADGTVLFSLDFLVTNDRGLQCMYVPVSFFWMDCGDNSMAFRKQVWGDLDIRQAIASEVYGYNGTVDGYLIEPASPFTFPAYTLDPSVCIDELLPENKQAVPFITFINGGVDIACDDDLDDRGDVNLNGVVYEIADAVVFTNYFIHGMAAFTINQLGQIAATDANADGISLSVADLVYMIRVVVGDALPYPKVSPVATPANIAMNNGNLSVDAELGAVAFVVEGEVLGLGADARHMELKTDYRDGMTYGVIYSFNEGDAFQGEFLNISGRLVEIEGATYEGAPMKFVHLPTAFAVKNYPNPFNPATTIEMALPIASDWNLSVYNVAGQKVKEFSGRSEAGTVEVVFDASSYASGIYFYKFQAGTEEITKKMVLLK